MKKLVRPQIVHKGTTASYRPTRVVTPRPESVARHALSIVCVCITRRCPRGPEGRGGRRGLRKATERGGGSNRTCRSAEVTSAHHAMPLEPTKWELAPPRDGTQWSIFLHVDSREKSRCSRTMIFCGVSIRHDARSRAMSKSAKSARNRTTRGPGTLRHRINFRGFPSQESAARNASPPSLLLLRRTVARAEPAWCPDGRKECRWCLDGTR